MTMDFQTGLRAVWTSILEPSDSARKLIALRLAAPSLWMALALAVVLNVLLIALLQMLLPGGAAVQAQGFSMSPFALTVVLGLFLVSFTYAVLYAGRTLGGTGGYAATLAIVVWFQFIGLTLEAIQIALVLISPAVGGLFGLLSLGAMIWCLMNFVNVLHGFNNILLAIGAVFLAVIAAAILTGIFLTILGLGPTIVPTGTAT